MLMNLRKTERTLRWVAFLTGSVVIYSFPLGPWNWLLWFIWGTLTLQGWQQNRIPVLMYHSISDQGKWIKDSSLVTPLKSFDLQMRWIKRLGYQTLFFDELYDMRRQNQRCDHCIAVTFDDGYLDNWVGAFHILQRYGIKATIFVATAWMDTNESPRPKLPDAFVPQIEWSGYLGPAEMQIMQKSGLVDIQSHAVSHDYIPISDEITGFISPDNQPHSYYCYLNPCIKPHWFKQEINSPLGYPVFKQGEALAHKEFVPETGLVESLAHVAEQPRFFSQADWEGQLRHVAEDYKRTHGRLGHIETDQQTKNRWEKELEESREQLEMITGKPVRHLAWPRNGYCSESEELALSLGYQSTTSIKGLHNTHRDPHRVERVAIVSMNQPAMDTLRLLLEIFVFKGFYIFWPMLFLFQRLSRFYVSRQK